VQRLHPQLVRLHALAMRKQCMGSLAGN
jgi:hypothetical protein